MNNKQKKTLFSSQFLRFLKKSVHALKPVVQVGKNGLSDGLILEIKKALFDHELVKIQFLGKKKEDLLNDCQAILDITNASLVEIKGNTISVFLKSEKKSAFEFEEGDNNG